jgi:hypothetical protein
MYPKTPRAEYYTGDPLQPMGAKIKLHGTFASIFVNTDGKLVPGSRNTLLGSRVKDHYDFDKFVDGLPTEGFIPHTQILGEWCGKGIQKGMACCQIQTRTFFVFAVVAAIQKEAHLISNPARIKSYLPPTPLDNFHVIPYYDYNNYTIASRCHLQTLVEEVLSKHDPYIKYNFGVSGACEGLVLMNPEPFEYNDDCLYKNAFKVKGRLAHKQ